MYPKRKFDRRYLLILIIIILAVLLIVLSVALNKERNLSFPEQLVKDAGTFTVQIFQAPVNFIKGIINETAEKNNIYEKYKNLKEKEEQIDKVIAENENLTAEINTLKEQLELNTILSDMVYKNATIVHRNIGYWYDDVTIDKGKKDGIEKGMAVINSKGLVGTVIKTSNYTSTVKLLGNEHMSDKISVKINVNGTYVYGLISSYDTKTNTYTVEGISENTDIPENADVVTTGMGNDFPSGLLVGKVTKVTTDHFDLSKVAEVKSSVDFNGLDYLTILKRKDNNE